VNGLRDSCVLEDKKVVFFSKLQVKSHFVNIGDFEKCNSDSSQCKSLRLFCVCVFSFLGLEAQRVVLLICTERKEKGD